MFAETQLEFAHALLDAGRPVPPGLGAHNATVPAKRFAVYRNNVIVGLVEAIRAGFPAVERIVGEEFFRAMARCYVVAHPPRSPLLLNFGDDFADFIAGFEPAAELDYLADVARLEFLRRRAYHAADAVAVAPERLAAIAADDLAGAILDLHPSVHVLRAPCPVVTIWQMNSGDAEPGPVDEAAPEDAMIFRPRLDVVVKRLPAGAAAFVEALKTGRPLGDAAAAAFDETPQFDLTAGLAMLIEMHAIVGVHPRD